MSQLLIVPHLLERLIIAIKWLLSIDSGEEIRRMYVDSKNSHEKVLFLYLSVWLLFHLHLHCNKLPTLFCGVL